MLDVKHVPLTLSDLVLVINELDPQLWAAPTHWTAPIFPAPLEVLTSPIELWNVKGEFKISNDNITKERKVGGRWEIGAQTPSSTQSAQMPK